MVFIFAPFLSLASKFPKNKRKIGQNFNWHLEDNIENENIKFGFNTDIKSHFIGLYIEPNGILYKYNIWYCKDHSSKTFRENFKSELELCVFLKHSKFKVK